MASVKASESDFLLVPSNQSNESTNLDEQDAVGSEGGVLFASCVVPWNQSNEPTNLDKQDAVGGNGGVLFDSGVGRSPLRKIYIHYGTLRHKDKNHNCIKRIFVEFDGSSRGGPSCMVPFYVDYNSSTPEDVHWAIELRGESVTSIDVWTDGILVNAVQFSGNSGWKSQLCGTPHSNDSKPTTFRPKSRAWKLAGIH
eukprot:jgi/Psemu1/1120/gm1.1120_g